MLAAVKDLHERALSVEEVVVVVQRDHDWATRQKLALGASQAVAQVSGRRTTQVGGCS